MDTAAPNIVVLDRDHPGFRDAEYRRRRNEIAHLALSLRPGDPCPEVTYTAAEQNVWRIVLSHLWPLHRRLACREFISHWHTLGFTPERLPRFGEVNEKLQRVSGFKLMPVAGLVTPRLFLESLGEGIFCSTQYLRHPGTPLYTPEPDLIHEFIGHAVLLADPRMAHLQRLFGEAARAVDDVQLEEIIRVYWYTVEFGLTRENGRLRVLGTGLLSSAGEMGRIERGDVEIRPLDLETVRHTSYDPTDYQPALFAASSTPALLEELTGWLHSLASGRRR